MGTTANGYPYPEPGDPVAQGAAAIKALAAAAETLARASAAGSGTITAAANGTVNQLVTLPAGRFKTAPAVTVNPITGAPKDRACAARDSTVTSFKFYLYSTTAGAVAFDWIARTKG